MFNPKTVFVIGAGAGNEIKMPIGLELAETIAKKLDIQLDRVGRWAGVGDHEIFEDIRREFQNDSPSYIDAGHRIRDGILLSNSIDNFIDSQNDNPKIAFCGKLAIVRSILEAEAASDLYYERTKVNSTIDFNRISDTWLMKFLRSLEGVRKTEVDSIFDNISIINFNYDRCMEHLLSEALPQYFGIDHNRAWGIIKKLKIFHPYGTVAPFSSPKLSPTLEGLAFGTKDFRFGATNTVARIKTYTEQVSEGDELKNIRREIAEANAIVFLGFAFHKQNIDLITPAEPSKVKKFYATRKGMSEGNLPVIYRRMYSLRKASFIEGKIPKDVFLAQTCSDLFRDYGLNLCSD